MSSRSIVVSSVVTAAALLATGLSASSAVPFKAVAASTVARGDQNPPRDRRPGEAGPETARERELKKAIEANPSNSDLYFQLAGMQEGRGATSEAEATMLALRRALPDKPGVLSAIAGFYNRTGQFDKAVAVLEKAAAMTPADPQGYQILATFYWEKAFKDASLSAAQKGAYIQAGIDATDRALAANESYVDALTYKNILLRMKASMDSDPGTKQALIAEADALRNRAMELQKAQQTQRGETTVVPVPGQQPPLPPPPPSALVDGQAPIRVGGNVRAPTKIRDVRPGYPADALAARVQGVVIIETTIDPSGNVSNARVLLGKPLLDQAALDAVQQWQFTPTLLNGVAVPVIMTVTVAFTMDQ